VLLSHDHHFDNLDHAGRQLLPSATRAITTVAGAQRLAGNAIGLEPWQTLDLPAPGGETVTVAATPAQHGPLVGERGPVVGFILTRSSEPESAIYISGDTIWFEGVEKVIERFPGIRVAVLFMGAAHVPVLPTNITLTADEAVFIAKSLPRPPSSRFTTRAGSTSPNPATRSRRPSPAPASSIVCSGFLPANPPLSDLRPPVTLRRAST
jgi:L-ascorbate metabolism protein UlaG (beta-lactamase superfamily)